jgi:hypothetical protein
VFGTQAKRAGFPHRKRDPNGKQRREDSEPARATHHVHYAKGYGARPVSGAKWQVFIDGGRR